MSTVPPPGRDFVLDWAVKELNLSSPPHLFSDNGFTDRREEQSPLLQSRFRMSLLSTFDYQQSAQVAPERFELSTFWS